MIRAARIVSLIWVALATSVTAAAALPLTPEDCDHARSEQLTLESSGVTADMARGAEWARANLEPERLTRIARWIELQEHILFRCPRPKLQPENTAASQTEDLDGGAETAKKPQKPKSARKPKPQSASAATETGDGAPAPATPATTKTESRKKPASQDAYRPPAPRAGGELQHAVPGSSVGAPNTPGLTP